MTTMQLVGAGAAYVRVSTDQQDTVRQHESIKAFGKRHGTTIPEHNWFEDTGWARDTADRRPEFQRLLKLAEAGAVRWVVVDKLDRFGTKNAKQLIVYLYRLDEYGCKLFDATGKEWTGEDVATVITAVVEGAKSKGEQTEKSGRVLGGKVAKARAGEWQGGPVRLGFDVGCYSRETGKEVWRVVWEGRSKRLKVFADGRTERFDGEKNFPQSQPLTEVLRVTPSRDRAKSEAAVSVFKRYASESISFTALAHYLNDLKFRSSYGERFHGHHIGRMLEDPIYVGYYTWNRTHHGKFHRYTGGQTVEELNYNEKVSPNTRADWVQSHQMFEPLVDLKTWAAVQTKLGERTKRTKAPSAPALYLSGLVCCGNCGGRMVAGPARKNTRSRGGSTDGRLEYMCGTYHRYVREGRRQECSCLRNGVFQDVLEQYVGRYLEDAGHRLELLTRGLDTGPVTDRLERDEEGQWAAFQKGIGRLTSYLAEHHRDEYETILGEEAARQEAQREADERSKGNKKGAGVPPGALAKRYGKKVVAAAEHALKRDPASLGPDDFVAAVLRAYRTNFDPSALEAQIQRLEEEHTQLTHRYADLPTPRAKQKAAAELGTLEGRITELERQREDLAGTVEQHYRAMLDLQTAVVQAKIALEAGTSERALRRRAEAVRTVIQRIECTFTATGVSGGGPGRTNARLSAVTIYPVCGESAVFEASTPALPQTRVVSR